MNPLRINITVKQFIILFFIALSAKAQMPGLKSAFLLSNNHRVYGEDIKYDSHGNMLVTGNFYADSIDCDLGIGNSFVKGNGKYDIFIAKYNSIGQHIWSFAIGSNDDDFINALYVDKNDNVFVTGSYSGSLMNLDPKGNTCILGNQGSCFKLTNPKNPLY